MVSWPPSKRFYHDPDRYPYGYRFLEPSQSTYPIGIIDSGIDPENRVYLEYIDTMNIRSNVSQEFDHVRPNLRWYYGPNTRATQDSSDTDGNLNFHGSCVASKAIGSTDGVYPTDRMSIFKISGMLSDTSWAFAEVRNSQTPIVVYP